MSINESNTCGMSPKPISVTSNRLTPADLDALEAALAKAAPGEWKIGLSKNGRWQVSAKGMQVCWVWGTTARPAKELGAAICAAHNALPALIAAARATVPEVIGDRHRDGQRWQLYFPRVYGWDVGYWQNGRWWVNGHVSGYTPTHALPIPPAPEGTDV
jgi:hypothetical protein